MGEAAWLVVERLAALEGAQTVWLASCGRPWSRRVVPGPGRDIAVDVRYVAAGPIPALEFLTYLPALVREAARVAPRAEMVVLPRGDWLLEAALLGVAPACPVQRWDPDDPGGPWPLCGAPQGA